MTKQHAGKLSAGIIVLAFAGLLAGAGCSTTDGVKTADPQKAVAAVEVALTAADKTATHYITLPLCGPTHAKPVCSEAAVSAKIKANEQKAYDAVKAARDNPALIDAAQAAVDSLVQSTPKTGE